MLFRKPKSVWVRGERAAARYLARHGMRVIGRNVRLAMGEIDILCLEKSTGTLVIVEVKARAYRADATKGIDPSASITRKKQAKLCTLARALKQIPEYAPRPIRIDAVAVRFIEGRRKPEIIHYPGCVGER